MPLHFFSWVKLCLWLCVLQYLLCHTKTIFCLFRNVEVTLIVSAYHKRFPEVLLPVCWIFGLFTVREMTHTWCDNCNHYNYARVEQYLNDFHHIMIFYLNLDDMRLCNLNQIGVSQHHTLLIFWNQICTLMQIYPIIEVWYRGFQSTT